MGGKYSLMEWVDAEEMHRQTNRWLSEFLFVKDEQRFLNNLLTDHTTAVLENTLLEKAKLLAIELLELEQEQDKNYQLLQEHRNRLEVLVDAIDQKEMEKSYRRQHAILNAKVEAFVDRYRNHKKDLFRFITNLRHSQKYKRLLR